MILLMIFLETNWRLSVDVVVVSFQLLSCCNCRETERRIALTGLPGLKPPGERKKKPKKSKKKKPANKTKKEASPAFVRYNSYFYALS